MGLWIHFATAQHTPSAWLASAWKDSTYIHAQALSDYRSQHPLTLPWLDKIELRTATNDFNFRQQEYGLRFFGSDPSEINFRKKLEPVDIRYYRQLEQDALHDALSMRYHILLEAYCIRKLDSLIKEQQILHQKKTTYLESLFSHQLDAEFKDLIQAYRKNEKINTEAESLNHSKRLFRLKSNSLQSKDSIESSGFEWITAVQIRMAINQEQTHLPVSASYSKLIQSKSQNDLERIRLKSSAWNFLDFFQARWRNNPNDELIREKISIGAGFRLPYSGEKRREQNQLTLEKMQIETEIEQYQTQYQTELIQLKQELNSLLGQLDEQKRQLQLFEIKFKQPALLSNPLIRPQDVILIDETILDWREEMLQVEKKLMEKYLEYLEHSRLISRPPFRNYFHAQLEKLLD